MEFRFVMHTKGEKVGSHKGCGFAEYKDVHVASAAIRTLNGYMLEVERASGRRIRDGSSFSSMSMTKTMSCVSLCDHIRDLPRHSLSSA